MTGQNEGLALPSMGALLESNALLGDRRALEARYAQESYLFLRGVLDLDAVAVLKRAYMKVLVEMGVVNAGAEEPVWNGADLGDFPVKIEALHDIRLWERFVANPKIDVFFRALFGFDPFWLPIVEYRITPPVAALPADPLAGRHQDGFYNGDLDCRTCWVPLMEIDELTGGLAMATGMRCERYLHDTNAPPHYGIPRDAIPSDAWRRSPYAAGDVIIFNRWIPHSGLPNRSDRFRLSMDVRVMPASGALPVWGEVQAFDRDAIVVRNHDGQTVRLRLDSDTYCRWTSGKRIAVEDLIAQIPPGDRVLAFHANGRATMLRPPR